ncbi:hypothetical protein FRC04_012006 [Tulasnella sp. 424]|nr:hypothetical protein FRC04_012006 [Tulasnella sp. 424]KAG8971248.1 hypothetical protein FRC05_011347 [Tulasnella sp. 425]
MNEFSPNSYTGKSSAVLLPNSPTSGSTVADLLSIQGTIDASSGHSFESIPNEVLENIFFFTQVLVEYRNTFGIHRAIAPAGAMLVCRKWREIVIANPNFWTDVLIQDHVDMTALKLHLHRAGEYLPLQLWLTTAALTDTATLDAILPCADRLGGIFLQPLLMPSQDNTTDALETFASQVTMTNLQRWIGIPLPNLRYLHLGALIVGGQPPTVQLTLPNLQKMSFGMMVPRFYFPESGLRYLGFISSLVTMEKLGVYFTHCQETLETLCLDGVTLTDINAPGQGFPELVMPHVTTAVILIPGGDGLAGLLLTNVSYPELRSLTFGATSGKEFGEWHPSLAGAIHLPNLDVLDFDGGILPVGAFQDILKGAEGIRKLVIPRFASQGYLDIAVNSLVAWSGQEGRGNRRLEEVVATGLNAVDMIRVVKALPSLKTLDVSGASNEGGEVRDSDEWRWLEEHVVNLIGLK